MKNSTGNRPTERKGTDKLTTHRGQRRWRRQRTAAWVLIGAAAVASAALLIWTIGTSTDAQSTESGGAAGETAPLSGAPVRAADWQALVGRWVRTDTPYVIEIKSARDDGTLEVSYHNPRSINVSRAEARDKGGKTEVFVELRDVNYPGSTYTLTYDRAKDLLQGVYFQAVLQQNFDVVFARLRPEP